MKTAIITGITGQDGAYLAKSLLERGYRVIGGMRRSASGSLWRLDELGILGKVELVDLELTDQENVTNIIKEYRPTEFYNLGANSFVANSFKTPRTVMETNAMSVLYELEAIKNYSPKTKFYQAGTSEMFGKVQEVPQRETTPFYPRSPYGVAKLAAYWLVKNYREAYGLYACNGILFNHESPLRGSEFVTKKITEHVARYANDNGTDPLELGNMNAQRDWGHSKDFVEAMYLMMQQDKPSDYVVATGEMHSVKEFVTEAFQQVGAELKWNGEGSDMCAINEEGVVLVRVNPKFYRPTEVEQLLGDATKARQELGWNNEVKFPELVKEMVQGDISRLANK
jgi:GDPmannose 4,6-dehydratase